MKRIGIEIKWAIIFIIMMTLWMVMEKMTGLHDKNIEKHAVVTYFVAIPAILIYVLALLDKRKNYYNGYMTYQQGFVTGLIMTMLIAVVTPLLQYVTTRYISPDYFTNMIRYSVDQKMLTQEDAEKMFNEKSYMVQATIGTVIMGLVTTAIVAIFTRRSPKEDRN
jgi:small-conductance mechanosensitive channel